MLRKCLYHKAALLALALLTVLPNVTRAEWSAARRSTCSSRTPAPATRPGRWTSIQRTNSATRGVKLPHGRVEALVAGVRGGLGHVVAKLGPLPADVQPPDLGNRSLL